MKTMVVSASEYAALLNVEQMVRIAMVQPDAGEFIGVALFSLDQVRKDEAEGVEVPAVTQGASELAQALIKRASGPQQP